MFVSGNAIQLTCLEYRYLHVPLLRSPVLHLHLPHSLPYLTPFLLSFFILPFLLLKSLYFSGKFPITPFFGRHVVVRFVRFNSSLASTSDLQKMLVECKWQERSFYGIRPFKMKTNPKAHFKLHGYLTGFLRDTQVSRAFSDLAGVPWWLLCMSNTHRACIREEYVVQKSYDVLSCLVRF